MKYVIANWKMAPSSEEKAQDLVREILAGAHGISSDMRIVVCPPFIWLPLVRDFLRSAPSPFALGAQNVAEKTGGAWTGEISVSMLKALGVSHILIGHSERRTLGENNEVVSEKLRIALAQGFTAILCVGETSLEGNWHEFLKEEVESAFSVVEADQVGRLIVAYEPVWAIGAKEPDTPDSALTSAIFIRKLAQARFGERAKNLPVLYGGAVLPDTVAPFALQEGIDGVLVGRASLDPQSFRAILEAMEKKR